MKTGKVQGKRNNVQENSMTSSSFIYTSRAFTNIN